MARIPFSGKSEDEATGGGGGKFHVATRGIYTLQITDHSNGLKTTGGNHPGTPMTKLTCEIADDGESLGTRVYHNVTWIPRGKDVKPAPGHGMAIHFLHAVGMPFDGEFEVDEDDFQGLTFRALLEVEEYEKVKDGRTYINEKNVVRQVYTKDHPEPEELPPAPAKKKSGGNPALRQATGARPNDPNRASQAQEVDEVPF